MYPVSIIPDFKNAKVGDKCFSPEYDEGVILCLPEKPNYSMADTYTIKYKEHIVRIDKTELLNTGGKHPMLFNSFAQFKAYWEEQEISW